MRFFTMRPREFAVHGKKTTEHGYVVFVYKKSEVQYVAISPEMALELGVIEQSDMNVLINVLRDRQSDLKQLRWGSKKK